MLFRLNPSECPECGSDFTICEDVDYTTRYWCCNSCGESFETEY